MKRYTTEGENESMIKTAIRAAVLSKTSREKTTPMIEATAVVRTTTMKSSSR